MSELNCSACSELRENAPAFIRNGVTDEIAESLENNTGLNPNLSVLHDNCTDLNNANDCLVGRMADEVEAYDVGNWKVFMKDFIHNLYEVLKAILASMCGLWERSENICDMEKMLIDFAVQDLTRHDGTLVTNHLTKNESSAHVSIHANTKSATMCNNNKAVFDLVKISISGEFSTVNLAEGDVIATWNKSDLVPTYMHESTWDSIMQYKFMQMVCTTGDSKAVFAYIGANQSYPNKMCMVVNTIVGPSNVSTSANTYTNQTAVRTFRIS